MAVERRRLQRLPLTVPVRVQGFLEGSRVWEEITATTDLSRDGARFPLRRHVPLLGHVVLLNLAMPKRLRQHDLTAANYRVYALVRSLIRTGQEPHIGVMFMGKYPPPGFLERPTMRFLMPGDALDPDTVLIGGLPDQGPRRDREVVTTERDEPPGPPGHWGGLGPASADGRPTEPSAERRQTARLDKWINFTLSMVDTGGDIREELSVADNISRTGARVMTSLDFAVGDVIQLREMGGDFATRAEIRGVTRAQGPIRRLHLRFLETKAPDRLLR